MDRKVLYQNVRKAYRLAYEVQDSIVEAVEYIRGRIRYEDCAGKSLFSNALAKRKNVEEGYVTDNIGGGMWSWDYFPTYMYMYYFTGIPSETRYSCFSIIQIMDDGFTRASEKNSSPSTKDFSDITDAESYLLLAYSNWNKDYRAIWFDYNGTESIGNERQEIIRISETIKDNQYEPYVASNDASTFIVKRIRLESIGSKAEADQALHDFAKLVLEKTGYQLLVDEPEEMEASHPVQPTQSVE
jgi:hypothetical protein